MQNSRQRPRRDRPPRRAHRRSCAPPRAGSGPGPRGASQGPAPLQTAGRPVLRLVDPTGYVSFAGTGYWAGGRHRGKQVEVRLVGNSVQISRAGELIRTHAAKHDRS